MSRPERRKSSRTPDAALEEAAWLERCRARILAVTPDLSAEEAAEVARSMRSSERTAAMEPEAAVDFVVSQMRQDVPPRFERRATGGPAKG